MPDSSQSPNPTLKAVAEAAGVSVMTVSRCLRNDPRHNEQTRQRVRKIAEDLGYRPNPLAAAFVATREKNREKKRSATIAFVARLGEISPNQLDLRVGVTSRTEELGLGLDELPFHPGQEQRLQRILRARGIRGVILAPFSAPRVELQLNMQGMTGVAIGRSLVLPNLSRIECDPSLATMEACGKLAESGIRRMGLALNDATDSRTLYRYKAGFLAWRETNAREQEMPLLIYPLASNTGNRAVQLLRDFAVKNRLQALLCPDQSHLQTELPEEVRYINLNLQELGEEQTGIYQGWIEQGRLAVDTVWGAMVTNQFEPREFPNTHQVAPTWHRAILTPYPESRP